MSNWDTVLSGMKVAPEDKCLEPLFHRQIKKCKSISHDIAIYERASEGAKERSYAYLYQAASNYLARRRLDRNRERMARQLGDEKPALPAAKRVPKGFCISFVKTGSCKVDNCKYKHQTPDGWKDRSQSHGRSQSRRRTGSPSPAGRPRVCKFYKQGRCDRGRDCKFLHTGQPGAAATSNSEGSQGRGSDKGKKGRKDKRRKDRKKSRSSSKSSKGSRNSKGSKGSKGSGKGKRSSASTAAAACLLGAMVAGATPQADAFTFRKEVSCQNSLCPSITSLALPAVSFDETPDYINVPIRDPNCNFTAVREPKRRYSKEYPVDFKPRGSNDNLRDAITSARMLRATIDAHEVSFKPKCNYECDTEFGCNHCIPKGMRVGCPAKISSRDTLDIEWIADTGSAQDLIARRELGHLKARPSERPINILTANGPSSAEEQCIVEVPSIASKAEPYSLPETPSVLSVGQRCMDEGYDFVWRAVKRPYFQQNGGKKVYMDVKDYVPYLKSWHENIATPARIGNNNPKAEEAPAGRLGPKPCETKLPRCAKTMLMDKDFSRQSCLELLKSVLIAINRVLTMTEVFPIRVNIASLLEP